MTKQQAIEYINSIMNNYNYSIYVDKQNPNYRLCHIWLSEQDIEAMNMAKQALREWIKTETI